MRERRESSLWKMLFMVFLLCTTIGSIGINVTSGVPVPTIYVNPPTKTAKQGAPLTVNIAIANVTNLYFWDFHLIFNSSVLECTKVLEGPFLKAFGTTSWSMLPPDIKTPGVVKASDLLWEYPEEGATGNGVLCSITFQTKNLGETTLHFNYTLLCTFDGETLVEITPRTAVDGLATVTPGHDVAVVSVTAPAKGASSSTVPIDATVENQGSYNEVVNVTVLRDSVYIDSKNVTVNKGASQTASFSWNTTGVSKGTYTIKATIPADDDTTDNEKTRSIKIVDHDVAVTDIDAPSKAKGGETVSVNATVTNLGSYNELGNVTLTRNETYIDKKSFAVNKGASQTVSFSWDTTGVPLGTYLLKATATIQADEDTTDNSMSRTIKLELLHDVNVTNMEAPTYAPLGDIVSINVTVKNEGDFAEVASVTVSRDSVYIDSENVALAKGENKTVSLTWNTAGLTEGNYYITAKASLNYTDTWTGDGTRKEFYTTRKPVDPGSEKVYVGGVLKTKDVDYTIDYSTGKITFTTAPSLGAQVKAIYFSKGDDDSRDNTQLMLIILTLHDVAVSSITAPSKGFVGFLVFINVTVTNEGYPFPEIVKVTLKYGGTLIGNETVYVYVGQPKIVSFIWNTTGVATGDYILNATATVQPYPNNPDGIDNNLADNTLPKAIKIAIWIPGDGDFNGLVEMPDFYVWREWFGKHEGEWPPTVNPNYETIHSVDYVDMWDFYEWRAHWGQSDP